MNILSDKAWLPRWVHWLQRSLCARLHLYPILPSQHSRDSIRFPYEATDLPAPLPTTEEIEKSGDVLLDYGDSKKVVMVGTHFLVKYGRRIDLEEGRTMMFVRETTSVPIPYVYALFYDPTTKKNYIVMEHVNGKTLQDEWSSLDNFQKKIIGTQIREYIEALRRIPSKAFCSVGNKPLRDMVFWTPSHEPGGPFTSESEFNSGIIKSYKLSKNEKVRRKAEYCKRSFLSELRGHRPVFTHGDLQRKNIMIRADSGLVLIDWETAGFYPEYWEYSRAYNAIDWEDDWESYLSEILQPFPREHNMLKMVLDDLFC